MTEEKKEPELTKKRRISSNTGISVFGLTSGVYGILMYMVSLPVILLFLKNK